jgi:hypothetical protein
MRPRFFGRWSQESDFIIRPIAKGRKMRKDYRAGATIRETNSMNTTVSQCSLIAELEARQDDLMLRLDELDKRVERTLIECQTSRGNSSRVGPALSMESHRA